MSPKITKKRIKSSIVSQACQSFIPALFSEIYSFKGLDMTKGKLLIKLFKFSFSLEKSQ